MYNVKYLTSFWPFGAASNLTLLGVYGGAFLYRNDDLLPRAYLVGEVLPAADDVTARDLLLSDAFDPRRSVLLDAPPPRYVAGRGEAAGSADLVHYTANSAELKVQTQRDALLVFSDSYYPGWVADVDGRPTPIYRANVTQRAVSVPAGEHLVRFRFEPMSIAIGCGVSALSALVLLGWSLLPLVRLRLCTERPKP